MLKIKSSNNELINIDKIKDPKLPEIVLFGLILVNFGPLNIFPKRNPPISEEIHISKTINNIILKWTSFRPKIKIVKNKNIYIAKKEFNKNCLKYFLNKISFDILVNSIKDKEKTLNDMNK